MLVCKSFLIVGQSSLLPTVCYTYCLSGGCLLFAFFDTFCYICKFLMKNYIYGFRFWFMHRKVSLFKYYESTYTCFFLLLVWFYFYIKLHLF